MSDDRQSWWEFDPDERPVPLDSVAEAVAEEAEEIVDSERQAIMREDTDPTLQTLGALREAGTTLPRTRGIEHRPGSVRRLAIGLLLAGCVATFSIGWVQGAAARGPVVEVTQGSGSDVFRRERVTSSTATDSPAASNEGLHDSTQRRTSKEVSKP